MLKAEKRGLTNRKWEKKMLKGQNEEDQVWT